jgi:hypothetical protein
MAMRSLSPERLAALVDESPTVEEQALLDASPALRAELSALRRVVAMASYERTHPGPPLTAWGALAGALRDEGLVTSRRADSAGPAPSGGASLALVPGGRGGEVAHGAPMPRDTGVRSLDAARAGRARGWRSPLGMAAAAALLVTVGAVGGRLVGTGAPPSPSIPVAADGERMPAPMEGAGEVALRGTPAGLEAESLGAAAVAPNESMRSPDALLGRAPALRVPVREAALPVASGAIPVAARLTTREQAVRTLQQLEDAHQQAVSWLAANDSSIGAPRRIVSAETVVRDLRRQIEVLDAAVAMGRRALYETPDDPVMNRYYFSALAAREVLLRKLAVALPASQQVLEY